MAQASKRALLTRLIPGMDVIMTESLSANTVIQSSNQGFLANMIRFCKKLMKLRHKKKVSLTETCSSFGGSLFEVSLWLSFIQRRWHPTWIS